MLAKIGRENRFPRDPHMLGLLSWKQEQVEGVAIVTIVVENILKELDIDQSKVALLKVNTTKSMCKISTQFCVQTGLCRSVNPGDVVFTRIWFSSEAAEEETFTKLHFESSSQTCGKPILTGKSNFIACACVITHSLCAGCYMLIRDK